MFRRVLNTPLKHTLKYSERLTSIYSAVYHLLSERNGLMTIGWGVLQNRFPHASLLSQQLGIKAKTYFQKVITSTMSLYKGRPWRMKRILFDSEKDDRGLAWKWVSCKVFIAALQQSKLNLNLHWPSSCGMWLFSYTKWEELKTT